MQPSPAAQAHLPSSLTPGHTPIHTPYMQQQSESLSASVPNLAAPLSYPGMPQPFPYQVQLQQDPRTGLFQLIPMMPTVTLQPPAAMTLTPQSPAHYLSMGQPAAATSYDVMSVASGHHSGESKSQPMSPYSGSSTDGEKPERVRHPRKKASRDRRAAKGAAPRQYSDSESGSSKSRSHTDRLQGHYAQQKQQQKSRLQRSRSDEGADDTTDVTSGSGGHQSNGASSNSKSSDLSPVLEHRGAQRLGRRSNTAELSDNTATSTSSTSGQQQRTTVRNVKLRDLRNKLKRAKSGSSVDYFNLQKSQQAHSQAQAHAQQSELKSYEIYDDSYLYSSSSGKKMTSSSASTYANLSRSQPNLDAAGAELTIPGGAGGGGGSFDVSQKSKSPSPPLSPSWSKDSGVSGMSLLERLLNGDTQRHQHRLSKVIKFIRDEFAFDGFMENGIEEMTMG